MKYWPHDEMYTVWDIKCTPFDFLKSESEKALVVGESWSSMMIQSLIIAK